MKRAMSNSSHKETIIIGEFSHHDGTSYVTIKKSIINT